MLKITIYNEIKTLLKNGQGYKSSLQDNEPIYLSLANLSFDEVVTLKDTLDELNDTISTMAIEYNCKTIKFHELYLILNSRLNYLDSLDNYDYDSYNKHLKMTRSI